MRADRWRFVVVRADGVALGFHNLRDKAQRLADVLGAEVRDAREWAADAERAEAEARAAEREAVDHD